MHRVSDLQMRVRKVLRQDWDPIGVKDIAAAQDEYDRYADELVQLVSANTSATAIAMRLTSIEANELGLVPGAERAQRVAEKLAALSIRR